MHQVCISPLITKKGKQWLSRKSMCLSIDLSESEQEVFNI